MAPPAGDDNNGGDSHGAVTSVQRRAQEHVMASAYRYVSRSASADSGDGATPALGGRMARASLQLLPNDGSAELMNGSYVSGPPPAMVRITDATKIALPAAAGTARLLALLPEQMARRYAQETGLLRTGDELAQAEVCTRAAPKPRFHGDAGQYPVLLRRMHALGMIQFTAAPRVVNGLFAVPKPGSDELRLIVNAIPANRVFVEPPAVQLPGPDLLAALTPEPGKRLFVAKTDIDGCYHRICLPLWLRPFFALPAVDAAAMRDLLPAALRSAKRVFPMCCTLPMGWSHSVALAQALHEKLCDDRTPLRAADRIRAGADGRVDRPRHAIYIDDVVMVGHDASQLRRMQAAYVRAAELAGLPVKRSKVVLPSATGVTCIGVVVDGTEMTVGVAPDKLAVLVMETRAILSAGQCTGRRMSELLGSWVWACLPVRASLSVFEAAFRFAQTAHGSTFKLWGGVRQELRAAMALAPLLYARLDASVFRWSVASDASGWGQRRGDANATRRAVRDGAAWRSARRTGGGGGMSALYARARRDASGRRGVAGGGEREVAPQRRARQRSGAACSAHGSAMVRG